MGPRKVSVDKTANTTSLLKMNRCCLSYYDRRNWKNAFYWKACFSNILSFFFKFGHRNTLDFVSQSWWKEDFKYAHSPWRTVHLADAVRLAFIWKYGGLYLDLDSLVLEPFYDLEQNVLGIQVSNSFFPYCCYILLNCVTGRKARTVVNLADKLENAVIRSMPPSVFLNLKQILMP